MKSSQVPVGTAKAVSPWILVLLACGPSGCRKEVKPTFEAVTMEVSAPRDVKDIACGVDFACALTDDGNVWCWGRNDDGQLGTGARANKVVPPRWPVEALASVSAITAGTSHACALVQGGRIACWGSNPYGQVGDGAEMAGADPSGNVRKDSDRLQAVSVVGLPEAATAVSAGDQNTCAILTSQRVVCWGMNLYDPGMWQPSSVPRVIEGLAGVEELALGTQHTCARLTTGEVRCWGQGVKPFPPKRVDGLCAKQLTAGEGFTCALSCNDEVLCWGEFPNGSRFERPTLVPFLAANIVEIRAGGGGGHVCARDGKGHLSCWGSNDSGQLGDDGPKLRPDPPAPSVLGAEARRVCAGGAGALVDFREDGERVYGHWGTTCTLSTSGEVRCWGGAMETYRPTLVDLPRGTK